MYPFEVIVVCVGMPLFATVTLAQYGWGKKVTVKVVVAAVRVDTTVGATSTLLHSMPDGGVTDWLEVAKALPAAPPVQYGLSEHLRSQYSAHSAPVSAAYIAYCDCVAVPERSSSRTVIS